MGRTRNAPYRSFAILLAELRQPDIEVEEFPQLLGTLLFM